MIFQLLKIHLIVDIFFFRKLFILKISDFQSKIYLTYPKSSDTPLSATNK